MERFVCTGCGEEFPIEIHRARCGLCGEPLEIALSGRGGASIRKDLTNSAKNAPLLGRFGPLLPMDALGLGSGSGPGRADEHDPTVDPGLTGERKPTRAGGSEPGASDGILTLGEGNTPLLKLGAIGESFGLPELYVKVEGSNPTGSFKDRGTVAGVQRARAAGFGRVGTVSTGNMAGSVAAYAARAGIEAVVLVSASIPEAKLAPIAAYGPRLIGVTGDYGALYELSLELGPELGIAFINSDDPFRVEGQKTVAFELWLQFGRVPDVVILPVSSGGHIAAVLKGFMELMSFGLTNEIPRLVGVQAAGCAPIATAFGRGGERIADWGPADTIAKAIANPKPPSGNRLLRVARRGAPLHFIAVSDEAILEAYGELMTSAGVFAQPDGAASIAGARHLRETGYLTGAESVVCILTGHGTKDLTPLMEGVGSPMEICSLDELASVLRY